MDPGMVVLVTDRSDGNAELAKVLDSAFGCQVVDPDVAWEGIPTPSAVVVDLAPASPRAMRCMLALRARMPEPGPFVLSLVRDASEAGTRAAKAFGPAVCLSHLTPSKGVARALVNLVHPGATLGERIVHRGVERAGEALSLMFEGAGAGAVDVAGVGRGVGPVLAAIEEGGLAPWLDRVRAHDDATFQHCLLVAGLSAAFSVRSGFHAADRKRFVMAAMVHDVGKSRIPVGILNKAGPLTPQEAEVMRGHAAIGHDILARGGNVDAFVLGAVRHHHEMLDGSGYPDGMSGDSISDAVRLLTVCDVYAALVERRAYRDPLTPAEAIGVLSSMGGKVEQAFVSAFADAVVARDVTRAA